MTSVAQAATNTNSPGQINAIALSSGNNIITPPASSVGVTIIMPTGNTTLLTLKGSTTDNGIVLHPTNPTHIALNSSTTSFVISSTTGLTGVQMIWS
jgi:hypothetical protein